MRVMLYIVTGYLLTACACKKPIVSKTQTRDTVKTQIHTQLRDTLLITPKTQVSTALALSEFNAPDFKPRVKQEKNARIIVRRVRDTIRIQAQCDTLAIAAQIKDRIIKETHQKQTVQTRIVKQKYVPRWIKGLAWMGGIALLLVG